MGLTQNNSSAMMSKMREEDVAPSEGLSKCM